MKSIFYVIDNVQYSGGAHLATFNQIAFLCEKGFSITVASLTVPVAALQAQLPTVRFICPAPQLGQKEQIEEIFQYVTPEDILCIPFENSVFRPEAVLAVCKRKIQWIHIDYAQWMGQNEETKCLSAPDGELYAHFDQIVFVSEQGRAGFLARFPWFWGKCAVCHNLLNVEDIRQKAKQALVPGAVRFENQDGRCKLLTVGRLSNSHKGIGRALLAAAALRDAGFYFEWVFCGKGEPQEEALYRTMVKSLHLADCVAFTGALQNPYPLMCAADLFVLPSFYEGIATVIYEAMIVGTPVFSTRVSGAAEQIEEKHGFIVENELQPIVEGLSQILQNPACLEAKRCALQTYNYENAKIQQQIEAIMMSDSSIHTPLCPKTPTVSIIVPIYNVAPYLSECLRSLLAQNYEDIEIIAVNDGSSDHCAEILNDFMQRYPNKIRRFDQPNSGPGAARNRGIVEASGRYLAFIDGDDLVEPDTLGQMVEKALIENADIVQTDLLGFDNETGHQTREACPFKTEGLLPAAQAVRYAARPVMASACTKLFRKSLFQAFLFPKGWYEDLALMPVLFSKAQKVYYLPKVFLHYRWNRLGSIQYQKSARQTLDIFTAQTFILTNVAPEFQQEAALAVYEHCVRQYDSLPHLTGEVLSFLQENQAYFVNNPFVQQLVKTKKLPPLLKEEALIPPLIHCCGFGPGAREIEQKAQAWQAGLANYTMRLWNEETTASWKDAFLQHLLKEGNYAAATAYARLQAVWRDGGYAPATHMEIKQPFDTLAYYTAIFGFATHNTIQQGFFAAMPQHPLVKTMLEQYGKVGPHNEATRDLGVCILSVLRKNALSCSGRFQLLSNRVAMLPANILSADFADGACVAHPQNTAEVQNSIMQDYFLYPALLSYSEKKQTSEVAEKSPNEAIDSLIWQHGAKLVIRQLGKALLANILPKKLYYRLEAYFLR